MKAESINTNTIGATGLCYLPGRIHLSHRKFQFGCSIRSWDHYTRNSSALMRLVPNSVICWGKKQIEPGLGARDAEGLTQPPAPLIKGLQSDPSKLKQ